MKFISVFWVAMTKNFLKMKIFFVIYTIFSQSSKLQPDYAEEIQKLCNVVKLSRGITFNKNLSKAKASLICACIILMYEQQSKLFP